MNHAKKRKMCLKNMFEKEKNVFKNMFENSDKK